MADAAATATATAVAKELHTDLSPLLKYYTDGTVERLLVFPDVPPSSEDPFTGVSSKDTSAIPPGVSARLFLPKLPPDHTQKLPILLYFHGGGFCIGSAFSFLDQRYLNLLCAESKALIITVQYRLAPEHSLPAAYEDSWNSLKWVCFHNTDNPTLPEKEPWLTDHGDFGKLFIGGDSAGGNIAHNMAMRASSEPLPGNSKISGTMLSFPFFWGSIPIGSEPKERTEDNIAYRIWEFVYPTAENGIDNPMINPMVEGGPSLSLLGCSKLLVCVAQKDMLAARGAKYVETMKKSGWQGEAKLVEIEEEDHCFQLFDPHSERAKGLIKHLASFISHD